MVLKTNLGLDGLNTSTNMSGICNNIQILLNGLDITNYYLSVETVFKVLDYGVAPLPSVNRRGSNVRRFSICMGSTMICGNADVSESASPLSTVWIPSSGQMEWAQAHRSHP